MFAKRDVGKMLKKYRGREKEKQHTAALSPDFPPTCSQTSSFNLLFSRTLIRGGQSWEDYNHASISIGFHDVNDEGERLESSNVASLFYSNDRLKNKPSGCDGFGLMGTNGNLLKLQEMKTVKFIILFSFCSSHQM